jgi:phosphoribosylformylglycinamidine cyclo-ligase
LPGVAGWATTRWRSLCGAVSRPLRLNGDVTDSAYARAGVDQTRSGSAVQALVDVLGTITTGRPGRAALGSGHYANVLRLDDTRGLALSTDSVGSKVIVCEQMGRFDTVGLDLIGMNANDIVCVGADPIALLDYIAVEEADPEMLEQIGIGLKEGAEQAQIEIPGGELAVLPDLIRGHPSPNGFDLVGFCVGLVDLDAIVTGATVQAGDALIGIPSSGIHSNGLSLARRVLPDLDEVVGDTTIGELLLEPTVIYVRAIRELLASEVEVRGLAHITGEGFLNLLRLEADVGYRIDAPLPVPEIFELIAERGSVEPAELYEVFNMGCGFCCVVPAAQADAAVALLAAHHPGTAVIGQATDAAGVVELSAQGLRGTRAGFAGN